MAVIETTRSQVDGRLFGGRFAKLIVSAIGTVAAWNDGRVTRKALSKLTDRELYDIGLIRGDIDHIAK
ncbi:MAG: DUF1127 domain-containing protein [Paracoccaceae bacterium]|jgi:uncharacterized protein YjiS (DUF1127 family)